MSEHIFKSSLTMEEIEKNFADVDVFAGIMDGLQEALAHSEGGLPQTYSSEAAARD